MIFSFIFIGADVVFDFVVQEYHVQMIELIIDDTMIGGVTNQSSNDMLIPNLKTTV